MTQLSNRSLIPTLSAPAMPTSVATVGFVRPCSMSWMCLAARPARSARSSCDSSSSSRRQRTRLPSRVHAATTSGAERASERKLFRFLEPTLGKARPDHAVTGLVTTRQVRYDAGRAMSAETRRAKVLGGFQRLRRRTTVALAAAVLVLVGIVAPARADVTKAKAHYEHGLALYQVGEYRQALEEFKAAHLEKPDPAFLYNMGQCFRQLGDTDSALTFYKRYLSLDPESPLRGDVERRIQELELSRADQPRPTAPPKLTDPPPQARPRITMDTSASTDTSSSRIVSTSSSPSRTPPLPRWMPWASAGLTLALGVAATVSGLSASSRVDDLHNSCGQTAQGCTGAQIASVKDRAHLATVLWAVTGIAAVGTGVTVYANSREAGLSGLWRF